VILFGALNGVIGSEIEYPAKDGVTKRVIAYSADGEKVIDDAVPHSKFVYRTLYFDENAFLDTVYTSYVERVVPFYKIGAAYPDAIPHEPGIVEAEDFDYGGEGFGFHVTPGGPGNTYRADPEDQAVHLAVSGTRESGETNYIIGWNPAGDWMNYTINAPEDGSYGFSFWAGSDKSTPIDLWIDGEKAVTVNVPNTSWTVIKIPANPVLPLTAGKHVIRIVFTNGGPNFDKFEFIKR
jgi:hypothetical protein